MTGPRPIDRVAGLSSYRRSAMPRCVDLRLDGNEGAAPPSSLLDAVRDGGTELLRCYPSTAALEEVLAVRHRVDPSRVLVTAGGDEALDRVFRAFAEPGRSVVLPEPGFEMLPRYAALSGCAVRTIGWHDGPFPTAAVLDAIDPTTAAVFVVTPNNPTGAVATAADLRAVASSAPHALIVLDHAYAEFGDTDLTDTALALDNVVVVRTLSKAWGLAGLRIGYALGAAGVVDTLRKAGSPYTVPAPSVALALVALRSAEDHAGRYVARARDERAELARRLRAHGFAVPDSQGNFVLARGPRAAWLADALRGLGIAIRRFDGRPGLEDAVRITCPGAAAAFDRLVHALDAALAPAALLFDLDGVLADVSRSYRDAILRTAATFGVAVGAADVRAVKAAGDANNDWLVTQRLCAARGVDVPLADVTERFERIYQGDGTVPGLRETERPLVEVATWRRWAGRMPLGIVTGRPRADAERFLDTHGLRATCAAVVCMEDGPAKPDPFPVRRALERIGVRHAWLLGDTRDDLDAARAAGVVPVGVVAPGEPVDDAASALSAHGAARVLTSVLELEELLP